jgi:hypothetical protein
MRLKCLTLLSGLALMLSSLSSRADMAFALAPAAQSGAGTNKVFFAGNLTNTGLTMNFLNDIQFDFDGAATNHLTADSNIFYANVPGILLPGEIYTDAVFGIAINPATPHGDYSGTATIRGGTNIFETNNLAGQTFHVSLQAAALAITATGGDLLVSWPSPPADFILQKNSDLKTTNWTGVSIAPAITNYQAQVLLSPSATNQFYRLKYP